MSQPNTSNKILGLFSWLGLSFITAVIGGIASRNAKDFYQQLQLPSWAPPGWLFGPVWTILYIMIAVAVWLVWKNGGFKQNRLGLSLFIGQMVLNGLWSWIFFAWHQGNLAFFEIVLLLLAIIATTIIFWKARPLAGLLILPYLLWVSFATCLTYTIWSLNPNILG